MKTMHGEERRQRGPAGRAGSAPSLLLAAVLGMLPAWSSAGSVLSASASMLTLDGTAHSVTLDLDVAHGAALRQIAQGQPAALPGDPAIYRSAWLVLDDVTLTPAGAAGGYFYKVYLTSAADALTLASQPVGMLGPFELAAARQRGTATLRYGLAGALASYGGQRLSRLAVSFRRAGGAANGPLMRVGSLRVELSTEPGN